MSKQKQLAVEWRIESTSDAQERLELAFAMLFSKLSRSVDNSSVDDPDEKCK